MLSLSSNARGPLRRSLVALLLVSAALPARAGDPNVAASAVAAASTQPAPGDDLIPEIIVIAPPLFGGVQPERSLDETAIESYGVSTVDELLAELQRDLGEEDDEPLILVNGERITDPSEIGAFPVEALRGAEVLPRGSAVRLGGRSGQRVVSLVLKRQTRSATVTVAPKIATEGDWHGERGELLLTHIRGETRANIGLRTRGDSFLREGDRGIIQPDPRLPFASSGNSIGFPNTAGEIDPLLSALAGLPVTVAPVPLVGAPTLADFAAQPNVPAFTDLGDFRTLRPRTRSYDLNGTFATRLAPWLTGNATFRWSRNKTRSLRGLPSGLFVLTDENAFSPFSTDVGLAYYGITPLNFRTVRNGGEGTLTLNGRFGEWVANFSARHARSRDVSRSERQSSFGSILLDDSLNPFAIDVGDLIVIRSDEATSKINGTVTRLTVTGPAATLPAGQLITTLEGQLSWDRLRSQSTFGGSSDRNIRRSEQWVRGALEVPLASRTNGFLPALGELSATGEYAAIHSSFAGALHRSAVGLTWEPSTKVRLRAAYEEAERPAPIELLGGPVIVTPEVRVFDPLTGETVDVVQIYGGNADLSPETTEIRRLTALFKLVQRFNLQLSGEYTDTNRRNFVSSLPSASAAVMLAFPDRYVRDSDGQLTQVDLRPVNFESQREKRVRWGLSMNKRIFGSSSAPVASPVRPTPGAAAPARASATAARKPPTYLQLSANHSMVLSDKIVIRSGLDPVDLLDGGAIGIGGGRVRHQIDGTAAVTSGGLGARIGLTWRGKSSLESRINGVADTLEFSPLMVVNARAFADMRQLLPNSNWAKGLRLSVDVINVTNDRQRIRDSFGETPLQYQPAYRDPLGRTIEFEIRKVF